MLNVLSDGLFLQIAWAITDTTVGIRQCALEIQPPGGTWTSLAQDCVGSVTYPGTQDQAYNVRLVGTNGVGNDFVEQAAPVTLSSVTKYYHHNGTRVVMRRGNQVYYLHGDHLGSTSLTTDQDGEVVSEARYLPFGGERWSDGSNATDIMFTSQRRDSYIKLLDYGARWYDAYLNRFISADTIVPEPGNSQAWNRYAYVLNQPLKYIDPTGHADECGDGMGGCEGTPELYQTDEHRKDAILIRALSLSKGVQDDHYSDLEAAAFLTEFVAGLPDNDFVNDVGMILTGLTSEYPGKDFLVGNQDQRYVDFLAGTAIFRQEGFDPVFQDPVIVEDGNNQSRHFWFNVQVSYHRGEIGPAYATIFNYAHETFLFPPSRVSGASYQDYALGQVGVDLGHKLYTGELSPNQVGDYMRENLSVNSETAQYWQRRMEFADAVTRARLRQSLIH